MKTLLISIATLFSAVAFAQTTSETRPVGDFTGLNIATPVDVEITQGDVNSVVIEGEAADVKKIETVVKDGVLTIRGSASSDELKARVTVKNLNSLELSGASNTTVTNTLITDSLTILTSGASAAKLNVQCKSIKATMSGASSIRLTGTSDRLGAQLSGASQLKAYQLAAGDVRVSTSGASSARVTANTSLDASASGASEIHYEGTATTKTVNASGSSSISMRGDQPKDDSTNLHIGNYDVHVTPSEDDERSRREKHAANKDFEYWEGLDFGINGYLTGDNRIELPPGLSWMDVNYAKSYVFGWNAFQKNIHIYKNFVNLGTGAGLTWYHYNFRNNVSLQPNLDFTTAVTDSVSYSHNRLNMCYVNIPLFLEFNTNNKDADNSFHIGAGMDFGYNVFDNKLKQKYSVNGHDFKNKVKDDFNVNPFRYDIIGRIGYGKFTIFGSYALSTLFEKDKGPVVYPFSAGVHISF